MDHLRNFFIAGKQVYANKVYVGITLSSFALLFSGNALFRNRELLQNQFSWKLTSSLILGMFTSFDLISLFLLLTSSLLAGIVITFSSFLIKRQVAGGMESAEASLPGLILSILLPACPSCALSIFGLFGIGSSLAFLPLKGIEFGLLTLFVILISLFYLAKKVTTTVCDIRK
ncbi:hypothetical protein HYX13_04975 [Candidatus Woesearchaeota archaeon]|nr:hypothetical protein [Candidatus Woesearchaeota archaeon]